MTKTLLFWLLSIAVYGLVPKPDHTPAHVPPQLRSSAKREVPKRQKMNRRDAKNFNIPLQCYPTITIKQALVQQKILFIISKLIDLHPISPQILKGNAGPNFGFNRPSFRKVFEPGDKSPTR